MRRKSLLVVGAVALLLWSSLSFGQSQPKVRPLDEREILRLERELQERVKNITYLAPVLALNQSTYSTKDTYTREYVMPISSNSGFVVSYRGRTFLLTAGHNVLEATYSAIFLYRREWYTIQNPRQDWKISISTTMDIGASDITELIPSSEGVGKLKLDLKDLKELMPLSVVCNPYKFLVPFTGIYVGLKPVPDERIKVYRLKIEHMGLNISGGCSGAPVVDKDLDIVALAVGKNAYGTDSYHVPSTTVATFLDEMFFKNKPVN